MTKERSKGKDGVYFRTVKKEAENPWKRNSGVLRAPGNGVQAEFLLPRSFLSSAAETVVYPTLAGGGEEFYIH